MENVTILKSMVLKVSCTGRLYDPWRQHMQLAHHDIPTLCYLKEINEIGACRMCVVEVKGARIPGSFLCTSGQSRVWKCRPTHRSLLNHSKKTLELLVVESR